MANREGFTSAGTSWGIEGAQAYAKARHGPDGARFLDPYFIPQLTNLKNIKVIDIGAGAGPWAVLAAQNGAQVLLSFPFSAVFD